MDRGAGQATVHGVVKSPIGLGNYTTTTTTLEHILSDQMCVPKGSNRTDQPEWEC